MLKDIRVAEMRLEIFVCLVRITLCMPFSEFFREDVTRPICQRGVLLDVVEPIDVQVGVFCLHSLIFSVSW